MVPFFIHFGFCCKMWLKKVNLKNHSKWFHFSFILVLSILLQNLAKKSQLKKIIQNGSIFHSFWFSIFCCKIWLKKVNLKKSFKMVPFFIHFGSQHFVAKFG